MIRAGPADTDILRLAVARLEALQAEFRHLSNLDESRGRREMIALRRRLQQEIGAIARLIDAVTIGDDDRRRLRGAYSLMRSRVALHQANWPAVAIEQSDPGYQASVRDVRAANRDFVGLVAAMFPGPRRS